MLTNGPFFPRLSIAIFIYHVVFCRLVEVECNFWMSHHLYCCLTFFILPLWMCAQWSLDWNGYARRSLGIIVKWVRNAIIGPTARPPAHFFGPLPQHLTTTLKEIAQNCICISVLNQFHSSPMVFKWTKARFRSSLYRFNRSPSQNLANRSISQVAAIISRR